MAMTLELPPELAERLTREARRLNWPAAELACVPLHSALLPSYALRTPSPSQNGTTMIATAPPRV